jgi:hypothetical protein
MKILRQYQLDIIFLFFALILIIWSYFYGLEYLGSDPHDFEWLVALPLMAIYLIYLFHLRSRIELSSRRKPTTKTMVYWIALGISMVLTYSTPVAARDFWSIRAFFIIFTLFLADSYWDFSSTTLKSLFRKKI